MTHLEDLGISILAVPDIERLGLERVRVFFRIVPSLKNPRLMFRALHETSGLRYYSRALDSHLFDCEFSIPDGRLSELSDLLIKLEELNLIRRPQVKKLLWKEVSMLKTEFYDYSRGEWDVDFSSLSGNPSSIEVQIGSPPESIDYTDLIMIKELEINPWIKTVELAKKSGLAIGDAAYHFNRHVLGKKLVKAFKLRWEGTREAWLKHSIISKTYVFEGISDEDTRHVMSIFSSLPFVWSHIIMEDGTYMVETMLPISQYPDATQYISSQLRPLDIAPSIIFEKDWSCLSTFTIPYMMFNQNKHVWEFRAELAIESILQKISAHAV
jgi:hypothetical protein